MSDRFTIDGSDALEHRLSDLCALANEGILKILPIDSVGAIVLGGGYGRGEGGVLATADGERPYNDLEFYALLKGGDFRATRRYGEAVRHLEETLSREVDVEFKLLSLRKLRRSPVTMFYYDLVSGHRLLHGTDRWVSGCEHHRAADRIPLSEAARLLMNRCSGLLFAQARLAHAEFSSEDADFVGRNLAKAKLAFGDVLLTMHGLYHWSCLERHKRLRKLAMDQPEEILPALALLHDQGVRFKLHPVRTRTSRQEFQAELEFLKELGRQVWLKLESRRLARDFQTIENYCADPGTKCPESRVLKNRLINARTFGARFVLDDSYPRERLLRSLPLLLWESERAEARERVRAYVRARGNEPREILHAYESLWSVFN